MKFVFLAFAAILALAPAHGRYRMGEEKHIHVDDAPAKVDGPKAGEKSPAAAAPNNERDVIEGLSYRYKTPADRLVYFRDLHHGYEEIVPALILAREAQVEPGKILKMRVDGKSWKDIAGEYSVDLKPLNEEVLDVLTPIRKRLPKTKLTERPRTRASEN